MRLRVLGGKVREQRFRYSLNQILERTVLCSVSTVDSSGRAYVNTAYFAYSSDLELYFLSNPLSQHARNIRGNPSVAVAVFDTHQEWGKKDRGVQLVGRCSQADADVATKATETYSHRFGGYVRWRDQLPPNAPARRWKFYEFVPSAAKILDEVALEKFGFVRAKFIR